MPGIRRKTVLLIVPFLLLNAAAWAVVRHEIVVGRNGVRLTALPTGDADGAEKLTLLFDRPLRMGDADEPPAASLFRLDPAPPGEWRWGGASRLEYVLSAPLPAGRLYRVEPTIGFESITGRTLLGDREIAFRTRALGLLRYRLAPRDDDTVALVLRFNQPVRAGEVADALVVRDAASGTRLHTEALSRGTGEEMRFAVPRTAASIRFTLAAGLAGHRAVRPLGSELTRTAELPVRFGIAGAEFDRFEDGGEGPDRGLVTLRFTDDLDRHAAAPRVRLDPPVADLAVSFGVWESELHLEGAFVAGERYTLAVPAGVLAEDGRVTKDEQKAVLAVPDRDPAVRIPFDRGILSPEGNLELPARVVNLPALDVRAWRVYANNLVPYLTGHERRATARELSRRTFPLDLEPNVPERILLDLYELLDAPLGLYVIEACSPQDRWTRDRAVVAVTDLGITVKRERGGLLAFVTSLRTAEPTAGVRVEARSYQNQVLARGETGEDGAVRLVVPEGHPDGDPYVVTAALGKDLAWLGLDRNAWPLDGADRSGRAPPRGYDLMLYPERGVYRPGDTVHLTGILRGAGGEVPEPFPLAVVVVRPDGHEVATVPVTPRDGGVFHADFSVPEDGQTGPWLFRGGLPGAAEPLAETPALVEAYVPARIEVRASPERSAYRAGADPRFLVAARYLFDLPAAGLPAKATWRYRRTAFRSGERRGFRFDPPPGPPEKGEVERLVLDADGRAEVEVPRPSGPPGLYRLELVVTVTEPGSRSVSARAGVPVDTAARHTGVALPAEGFAPVGRDFELAFVQRDPEDGPADPAPIRARLLRVVHDWSWRRVNGRWAWRSDERTIPVRLATAGGGAPEGTIPLLCPVSGRYRLEIEDGAGGGDARLEFHAAAGAGEAERLALASPERVELVPDRAAYEPGATAKILVRSPFAGTLLLTLEAERVLDRRVLAMTSAETEVEIAVPASVRGGAFVTASVVRAVDPDDEEWLPHRAVGLARLPTIHEASRLPVAIDAPDRARPGERVTVTVTTGAPGALVHLYAVDEGILQLTAQETPDPHGHFFAPRADAVRSADVFPDLLPDIVRAADLTRIGGDGDRKDRALRRLRRNPVPAKRRRAVVIWREAVPADGTGKLVATLDLPETTGAIRLMAVAAAGDAYGSAERRLVLATKLMVEAGWPRFLAPGDRCAVPVKVMNRTGEPLRVDLAARVTGPVAISGAGPLDVAAGGEGTVWLEVRGTGVGPAAVTLDAAGGEGWSARSSASFPVRPATPLHAATRFARLPAGGDTMLAPEPSFAPGPRRTLVVSARPEVELRPALERLLDYPYGCVEQTTSRLVAILHAPDLLERAGEDERAGIAAELIARGVAHLRSMQTRYGGLAYWPGGTSPCRWGSAYAASFLAMAREAGYEIAEGLTGPLLGYLEAELRERRDGAPDADERALICRALCSFARPPLGEMTRLLESPDELDMEGRAHLALAWHLAGRTDRALSLLTDETFALAAPVTTGGRLTSPVRQLGVLLGTLLDVAPDHPRIPDLVRRITAARTNGRWRSTLSDAAAVAALARYEMAASGEVDPDFTVTVHCGDGEWTADHTERREIVLPAGEAPVRVTCRGRGTAFLVLQTEGLAAAGAAEEHDRGILVRRRWTDPDGGPIDFARIRVGDLVRVVVELRTTRQAASRTVGNVAVVDALPGGFEVENPRLSTSAVASDPRPEPRTADPDRVEFLDDRVVLFSSADRERRRFVYHLRAVTAGRFVVPPIQASCMYEPELASVHGRAGVEVRR